ncbi:hypothetical protein ABMA79_02775 [Halobacteriovorax sp. HFRX-2_2]|uniref:hypothetical protein n=1 Tax=unclassified Halobacteriovorax TaxID=2639665 RepID=UPI003715279C
MKKIIILAFFASSIFANTLTAQEESRVVTEIDNICGDTWCEGDFNFRFDTFKCNAETNSCVLDFVILDEVWGDDDSYSATEYEATCEIKGYTKYDQMIEVSRNGWPRLNNDFYFAVTDCVTEQEEVVYDKLGY